MALSWKETLASHLKKKYGQKKGAELNNKYTNSFPLSYQDAYSVKMALSDVVQIESLSDKKPLYLDVSEEKSTEGGQRTLHLRLYQLNETIALSDVLPMLENLDLRTLSEYPYKVKVEKNIIFISDFTVIYLKNENLNINRIKSLFQDAFINIRYGICENDGFNRLVLGAEISWQEVTIIRAYAKYLHQIRFRFSQVYIEKTVQAHDEITKNLIKLFILLHNPHSKSSDKMREALEENIKTRLDKIVSLDEDRIMRFLWRLIKATLRTNYFQVKEASEKNYLAFKLKSSEVPELPLPHPLYEIFVYSPRFEAIHLRSHMVARGGIRWSDRLEDYRTEVLGLMKAQVVKNAIIVPSGAKGGFVLKRALVNPTRAELMKEVIYCYKSFMHALLDLTDNIVNNKVIRPSNVICRDGEDTYLVVAADKGTASFSDIANSISKEYNYWLGDAFASGGSTGYDHKKMGITAKGAWESIRRHFQEKEINIDKTDITVVGIGDMSGDVFGNGMLYNNRIKLIAAFDNRNIFLDPNPNPLTSYKERLRLYNLPNSSWEDYNKKLISKGGGVFARSAKSISLSAEIKACLEITDSALSPNELIKAILKASVDLFYNGGIGTYVKAATESHADVGDKTNDFCRVNGQDLRCKVVGEGGNLGFTQLGRIEYATLGGLINTDFIDNSAGVDCSDHEVNIKILLDKVVAKGKLSEKKRNKLLATMTKEVGQLVLLDNYNQALAMSFSSLSAPHYVGLHQSYLKSLEKQNIVDRVVEFLPDDKTLLERKAASLGLTRPEVAVLLAYTKINIKHEILKSDLPEDPCFTAELHSVFPKTLCNLYGDYIKEHTLRREIIATQLSNNIVNSMGITFVYRVQMETGAEISEVIKAHSISSRIFGSRQLEQYIDSLSFKIPIKLQYELLHYIRHLLNLSTRWFLRSHHLEKGIDRTTLFFSERIKKIQRVVPKFMVGNTKIYLDKLTEEFVNSGLSEKEAHDIALYRALYISLNIIEVSTKHKFDLLKTAKIYFEIGGKFNLVWFRDQIANDAREGHWNALARLTLRDELDGIQSLLTVVVLSTLKGKRNVDNIIDQWIEEHPREMERWENLLQMLHGSSSIDYTMFFIALRELTDWIRPHAN